MTIKYTVHTIPDGFGGTYDAVIETGKCGNFPTVSGDPEYEKFLQDIKNDGIGIVTAKDVDGNEKEVPSWVSEAAGI